MNTNYTHFKKLPRALTAALYLFSMVLLSTGFTMAPASSTEQGEWTLVAEQNDVKAYARISDCGEGQSVFLLKFQNNGKSAYRIDYTVNVTNDPTAGAIKQSLSLLAGSAMEGECNARQDVRLSFYAFGESPSLNQIQINFLTLQPINYEN